MTRSFSSPKNPKRQGGLTRRQVLRGACGVAVGLPLLESLLPREARAAAGSPRRFIGYLTCNGVNMQRFRPSSSQLGPLSAAQLQATSLAPLAGFADKLIIPRGIHTSPVGFSQATPGDDHVKGWVHRLTASPADPQTLFATGISVDQAIAQRLNDGGSPALTLKVGPHYDATISVSSYLGPNQPVVGENNPWLAYQDLMGLSGLDDEQLAAISLRRQSVLDLLETDFSSLGGAKISAGDRQKLDMHLTAIRDLEVDLADSLVACTLSPERAAELAAIDPARVGFDSEYRTIGQLQLDIIALAIACGSTHAATLQWHNGVAGPIFTWDGMAHQYSHHKLSHGNTQDDNTGSTIANYQDLVAEIDTWYAGAFADLLGKLAAYDEGDGTVLDNCCVAWMHDLADGLSHSYQDMPHILAGSCGGYLRTGQQVKVTASESIYQDQDAGHNQLLTTILNAVGVTGDDGGPVTNFGDPRFSQPGELDGLKA